MQNDGKEEEDERAGKLKIVMMKILTFSLGGFLLNLERSSPFGFGKKSLPAQKAMRY